MSGICDNIYIYTYIYIWTHNLYKWLCVCMYTGLPTCVYVCLPACLFFYPALYIGFRHAETTSYWRIHMVNWTKLRRILCRGHNNIIHHLSVHCKPLCWHALSLMHDHLLHYNATPPPREKKAQLNLQAFGRVGFTTLNPKTEYRGRNNYLYYFGGSLLWL